MLKLWTLYLTQHGPLSDVNKCQLGTLPEDKYISQLLRTVKNAVLIMLRLGYILLRCLTVTGGVAEMKKTLTKLK